MAQNIIVSPSPHIYKRHSTQSVMLDVIIGLVPAMIAAVIFFRTKAVVLTLVCVASCCLTEWLCNLLRKKPNSLGDLSAVITGMILAFSVPPTLPYWAMIIGSVFAIAIGKMVFGGLGANIFNPAMAGRCFLTACFGTMMTTWTVPATIDPNMPQVGTVSQVPTVITQATPLALIKEVIKNKSAEQDEKIAAIKGIFKNMFIGSTGGCLGETSSLALLIGGVYLLIRKTISWIIPTAVLGSAFICAFIACELDPQHSVAPWIHLASGGLLICAFFIATDPVTAPLTKKGMWIFGAGVGALTMLIRLVGEYPEGVMFAILLMNSVTPLIDRFTKLTPAGGKPNA
ncbi:MAG: RnfABCDGE type electron transport complex subunit D [Planctomycetes bacterium]|nr:RnfABCDGE type electron transport complex subunit D [Planctomycetota bacterium]MBU1518731.1 RnfABCDGE type electron transport complex subunit D [Planctomycetota bacterium]MBU2457616.1 RnfABCDGE type electron transport complex subunit D [Planctomycetota bacterium]